MKKSSHSPLARVEHRIGGVEIGRAGNHEFIVQLVRQKRRNILFLFLADAGAHGLVKGHFPNHQESKTAITVGGGASRVWQDANSIHVDQIGYSSYVFGAVPDQALRKFIEPLREYLQPLSSGKNVIVELDDQKVDPNDVQHSYWRMYLKKQRDGLREK